MAVDLDKHRLVVAELGNDTVEIIEFNLALDCHRAKRRHEESGDPEYEIGVGRLRQRANAGAAPQQSAGDPQGFSALCWRRHGLRIARRVRGPCADKDVPPVSLLRTAVSVAREAGRAPRFRALVWRPRNDVRPLWPPSSVHADESSPRVRAFAHRRSVRARSFRLSSKTP